MLSLTRLLKSPVGRHALVVTTRALAFTSDEIESLERQMKEAKNAFKMFNLEEKLKIDERKLKREMHKLQRAFHPDKIASSGKVRTGKTDHFSVIVNSAYQTLIDPYKRARYLLEVKLNKTPDDIEKTLDELILDPDFLARMMELREQLEQLDERALFRLAGQVKSELDELIAQVDKDFQKENYDLVFKGLAKLKFVANCHTALKDKIGDDI